MTSEATEVFGRSIYSLIYYEAKIQVALFAYQQGALYIIDILRDEKQERTIKNKHRKLRTLGIGQEYSKTQWRLFCPAILPIQSL